ncbi:MAG TPA: hypothetical protein VET90_06040, partial [Candidatus Binatus sp.]|nr:hypothetical protein [Candidatus Binatus sp.]
SVGALFSSEVAFTQELLLWEDGVARKLDIRIEPDHDEAAGHGDRGEHERDPTPVGPGLRSPD